MGRAVHEVEEAAAALLSGPDNHVRQILGVGLANCQTPATLPCGWASMAGTVCRAPCSRSTSHYMYHPAAPLQMDANLQAVHKIQEEDAAEHPKQQDAIAAPAMQAARELGGSGASSRGLLELLASWAGTAQRSVASLLSSLQAAFFNYCRQRELGERAAAQQQFAAFWPPACTLLMLPFPLPRAPCSAGGHARQPLAHAHLLRACCLAPGAPSAAQLLRLGLRWVQVQGCRSNANVLPKGQCACRRKLEKLMGVSPAGPGVMWPATWSPACTPLVPAVCCSPVDHTRRLVSVQANAKFGSPSAGPENALNVGQAAADSGRG